MNLSGPLTGVTMSFQHVYTTQAQPQQQPNQPYPINPQGSPTIVVEHIHKEKTIGDYVLDWFKFFAGLALFRLAVAGVSLLIFAIIFIIIVSAIPGGWVMITS
jgi:hypothetical protein